MIAYVIIAIGSLWGILTFIGFHEEDEEIKEMIESARKSTENKRL